VKKNKNGGEYVLALGVGGRAKGTDERSSESKAIVRKKQ